MKQIITILIAILVTAGALLPYKTDAQSLQKISYQAIIRGGNDALLTNITIGMKISILQGSAQGTAVYAETQTPLTNANGLVSIEIGTGTTGDNFSAIDWANGPFFIKTETDLNGGTAYTISGTSQLLSVPYSRHAITAAHIAVRVSPSGDTLNVGANQGVIVPGISDANTPSGTTVTDADGNIYQTITIGTQEWLAENLKTTKYNDGTPIPLVTEDEPWSSTNTPAYCWYENDQSTYGDTYGALYNWYTVETGNLCPTGWHVPTDDEWTILTDYLGGSGVAGGKLKETGTAHWALPNTGATNETGFTALPGGYRHYSGSFSFVGLYGDWWSSTESFASSAYHRLITYDYGGVDRFGDYSPYGYSIRCLKD